MDKDQVHLSADDIQNLPLQSYDGEVEVISNNDLAENAAQKLQNAKIIGFDTETRPTFKKGVVRKVSLLQLFDGNKAYLFRLNELGLPNSIKKILQNPNILKIGAAIHDDIKALAKLNYFKPEGFIDLQTVAKNANIEDISVKKMTARFLGFRISKKQQLSNWDNEILEEGQIVYAATDAWVCYLLYFKMKDLPKATNPLNK